MYADFTREQLLAEVARWKEQAARNASTCIRYKTALKLARKYGMNSHGFDGGVSLMLGDWFDAGMSEGVPWPSSIFAQKWLASEGYSDCHGKVGLKATMTIIQNQH
jgi:hypothetical protein